MLVLLTGATGFVGGHIASQLLEAGHTVRAVVRTGRSDRLFATFPKASKEQLQATEVASNDKADYTEALKGVDAVIHCASPAFAKGETKKDLFEGGYKGTELLLKSAVAAGIKKVVLTGSIVSLVSFTFEEAFGSKALDQNTYNSTEIENFDYEAVPDLVALYVAVKTLTDKLVWKLADQHPDVDFTVLVLPTMVGPNLEHYTVPQEDTLLSLGTPGYVYGLVRPDLEAPGAANPFWHIADVRDVAKAHVLALSVPPSSEKKRFILTSKTPYLDRKEVIDLIRKKRPELSSRITTADVPFQMTAPYDTSLTERVLGLKEYIPWKESILLSLDAGLEREKAMGIKVKA